MANKLFTYIHNTADDWRDVYDNLSCSVEPSRNNRSTYTPGTYQTILRLSTVYLVCSAGVFMLCVNCEGSFMANHLFIDSLLVTIARVFVDLDVSLYNIY